MKRRRLRGIILPASAELHYFLMKIVLILLWLGCVFASRHPICAMSRNCGDGYCCKYNKGCFCSHYECYELCSHGDLLWGKDNLNKLQNGAVPSIRAEKNEVHADGPTFVVLGDHHPGCERDLFQNIPTNFLTWTPSTWVEMLMQNIHLKIPPMGTLVMKVPTMRGMGMTRILAMIQTKIRIKKVRF